MKKGICFVLVLALLVTAVAFAAEELSFDSKTGTYADAIKPKTSATGSSGSVTVSSNEGGHSMYYQIHKANGGAATVYKNTSGTGTYTLSYEKDGYGNSLGRNGYSYRLRVAHRSQCSCTSGSAVVEVDFTP